MTVSELKHILDSLCNLTAENEIVEFKEAKSGYDFNKLGKYFSALSNEANLKGKPYAWLVFGVENMKHRIVGSHFRPQRKDLDSIKSELANKTTNRITFIEIYELNEPEGRVVMFQIPAAPKGFPIAFDGHYYGRDDEELSPLNLEEIERIRAQATTEDWSAAIIPDAKVEDLDEEAIALARRNFKNKFPERTAEVEAWDDSTFLNKAKITIKGKLTRTAIILLGKEESEHFINPAEAKIRWLLKDVNGNDKDYAIIGCPMILAVDKVYAKIRNLKYRYIKEGTLFPDEVNQYEPYSIREALNNCIAHQDYTKHGRINVVEMDDQLIFTNYGSFIPGSVEKVVKEDAPEEHYRNRFLAAAMFNLKMVDTAGGGIKKIFNFQRERFFPMPDYDLSGGKVKVTISGKVLDIEYARLLARNKDLTLEEIIMLDKVQKKQILPEFEEKHLKTKKLIEGRKPNYFIGLKVVAKTGQKAAYSKNKAFDKAYYLDLIEKSIREHISLERSDVDELLWNKLPEWMDEKQKKIKINNLLSELRKNNKIENKGTLKMPKWVLINKTN
ncbi:MAG: putative DNA binding domain-containing protein [Cytophagales bacterium]|jgi:ATP-dependent DNA helicase RecG|nr:putative DNA binding domain-containing protein [Cytophagales bacterium]MCA6390734.1 putative DNA binding domain-containing protein [Cytophagales bacterium]MCA6403938.1 putative DNA binding domain-containing protein [Cytophagales bacterium]MCA6405812.1 putative DNA binding domain-containing protein [Cytophagales bacterium]MCA6408888.1 putative DNA binding domain-containing protein [Cytophagales bacterium]